MSAFLLAETSETAGGPRHRKLPDRGVGLNGVDLGVVGEAEVLNEGLVEAVGVREILSEGRGILIHDGLRHVGHGLLEVGVVADLLKEILVVGDNLLGGAGGTATPLMEP